MLAGRSCAKPHAYTQDPTHQPETFPNTGCNAKALEEANLMAREGKLADASCKAARNGATVNIGGLSCRTHAQNPYPSRGANINRNTTRVMITTSAFRLPAPLGPHSYVRHGLLPAPLGPNPLKHHMSTT